ncbi:MAG TPA: reverse transcriptase family protein [Puia sp.]|nr:reverse transcriptase family protein [Puia sp.]
MTSQKILKTWNDFFSEKGLEKKIKDSYISYIKKLLDNNVPIIFEFNHLALLLGRQKKYLASVVNSPSAHYRSFYIPKRKGGEREITAPYPALLEMQYWIFHNILKQISVDSSAHGFVYKKSILTNARIHAGEKELLKIDLLNFFPSINLNRIIYVFKSLGYPNEICYYLAAICSYNGYLPQGAPTSPYLSNIIAKQLDKRLINFSKKYDLKYSRYADDLTFSGKSIPSIMIEYIAKIIQDEGFEMNLGKTRLYKTAGKRIVTGISVLKKEIKLPRNYKRDLKQDLFFIFKYGLPSHIAKKKIRKANYLLSLIGKVSFWLSIEPDDLFAIKAKEELLKIHNSLEIDKSE